jgi:hypothetical protein
VRNFGGSSGIDNGRSLISFVDGGGRCVFGLGLGHDLGLGFDRFGGRFSFSVFGSWLRSSRSFFWLGRGLRGSGLTEHACPGLHCRGSRLGCLCCRRWGRLFSNGLVLL